MTPSNLAPGVSSADPHFYLPDDPPDECLLCRMTFDPDDLNDDGYCDDCQEVVDG